MSNLKDRLRSAMKIAGLTQADLARACGVRPPSVAGWLDGKSKYLRGENLLAAAKALHVSPEWLAVGDRKKINIPPKRVKSVRITIVMYPEIANALKEVSKETGRSMNEICCHILASGLGFEEIEQ